MELKSNSNYEALREFEKSILQLRYIASQQSGIRDPILEIVFDKHFYSILEDHLFFKYELKDLKNIKLFGIKLTKENKHDS